MFFTGVGDRHQTRYSAGQVGILDVKIGPAKSDRAGLLVGIHASFGKSMAARAQGVRLAAGHAAIIIILQMVISGNLRRQMKAEEQNPARNPACFRGCNQIDFSNSLQSIPRPNDCPRKLSQRPALAGAWQLSDAMGETPSRQCWRTPSWNHPACTCRISSKPKPDTQTTSLLAGSKSPRAFLAPFNRPRTAKITSEKRRTCGGLMIQRYSIMPSVSTTGKV